jgi:hypothetical protein
MRVLLLLLSLVGLSLAGFYQKRPKDSQKCYQCSYTPDRVRVQTVKVPRTVFDVVRDPVVVSDTVTRLLVEEETVPVTKLKVVQVPVTRLEVNVIKVPQQVTRLVEVPRIEKNVVQVPRLHKYPVHFARETSVPVTRTRKEKVPVATKYGKPSYDFKVVTYQDVEKKVVQDTVMKAAQIQDPVVFTRQVIDTNVVTDTIYVTREDSRVVTENVPKEIVVTEQVTRPVERVISDVVTRQEFTTRKVPRQVYDHQTVQKKSQGGWDKCMGPFDGKQAREWGIDEWDCEDNCYVRVDGNGNVSRGCYKGEFGVNPNALGCSQQAGATYCFCQGELCNNGSAGV